MLGSSWSGTVLPCKLLSVRYTKAKRVWSTLETQLKVVEEPLISQGPRPRDRGMFSSDAFGVLNETCINEVPCGLFGKLGSQGSCVGSGRTFERQSPSESLLDRGSG